MERVINVIDIKNFTEVTKIILLDEDSVNILSEKYKDSKELQSFIKRMPLEYDSDLILNFYGETGIKVRHEVFDDKICHVFDRFGSYPKGDFTNFYNCLEPSGRYIEDLSQQPIQDEDVIIYTKVNDISIETGLKHILD